MKEEFYGLYKIIGVNVRMFRDAKQWTQDDLASRCSVNRAKISRIENARKDYMLSTLLEVCKALDKNIDEMLIKYKEVDY